MPEKEQTEQKTTSDEMRAFADKLLAYRETLLAEIIEKRAALAAVEEVASWLSTES